MSEKQTRRHFSPEDKVAIVKRHLLEGTPVSKLCDEFAINPTLFYQWQRQLFENAHLVTLTEAIIKSLVEAWIGNPVDPENSNLHAKIVGIAENGVRIEIPSGERLISFEQIINADKVILHCRQNGREPAWKDFKIPDPATSANRVHDYSYAPPLAKRIRRQIEDGMVRLPEEVSESFSYREGSVQRILVNRYERDSRARDACIQKYGTTCFLCGFDFVAKYGQVMAGFIHVHHLTLLSTLGSDYKVDPIKDLRPVCPNCHAVIHRREPPYSIDEVRRFLQENAKQLKS